MRKALRATVAALIFALGAACSIQATPEKAVKTTPPKNTATAEKKKQPAAKPARRDGAKLVMIVADGINLKDFNDPGALVNFHKAVKSGALGLMVTGAPNALDRTGAFATLGAGSQMSGTPDAAVAYNVGVQPLSSGQTVLEAWLARMPGDPPALESDTVLNLGLPRLAAANLRRASRPGALGELLSSNGVSVCVYGNADYDGRLHREVSLIGMDARGVVRHGDVDWSDIKAFSMKQPFAAAPDLDRLKDAFYDKYIRDESSDKSYSCDFIIIDLGDTARAEQFRSEADLVAAESRKRQAVERLDDFLGFVLNSVDAASMQVMLVGPVPSSESFGMHESMTPVLVVGGGMNHGLLTSATTRGRGLVTNIDIAPHVLSFFGIEQPVEMEGAAMSARPAVDANASLLRLQFMDAMRLRMGRLLQSAILLAMIVIVLAYLTVMRMPRVPRDWQRTLGVGLSICAALFPALIISSLVFVGTFDLLRGDFLQYIAFFAATAIIIGGAVALLPRAEWRALSFIIIYILLFGIDTISGGALSRTSVMAASPQQVLRFFGAENTIAGLLLGASLAGVGLGLDLLRERVRTARWVFVGALMLVAAIVGIPIMGANYGMLLVVCIAFAIYGTLIARKRIRLGEVMALVAVALISFALFAVVSSIISSHAHIPFSRTFARVQSEGGLVTLAKIALWRVASNLYYIRTENAWSLFYAGLFICGTAIYYFPNQRIESLFRRFRFLNHALITSLVCSLAAFAFIYPGAVPAASLLFAPVLLIIMLAVNPSQKPADGQGKNGRQNSRNADGQGRDFQKNVRKSVQPKQQSKPETSVSAPTAPTAPSAQTTQKPAVENDRRPQSPRRDDRRPDGRPPQRRDDRDNRDSRDNRSGGDNRQQHSQQPKQKQPPRPDRPPKQEEPYRQPGVPPVAGESERLPAKEQGDRKDFGGDKQRYYYRDGKRYYGRGGGGKRPPSSHDGGNRPPNKGGGDKPSSDGGDKPGADK